MSDIPNDNLKNHECANENPKDIKLTKLFQVFCERTTMYSRFVYTLKGEL